MIQEGENWVKDYVDYMKISDFENALLLKEKYFPESLFKYRELDDRTLKSLEEGWLWMSKVDELNDSFECSLLLDHNEIVRDLLTNPNHPQKLYNMGLSPIELQEIEESTDPFQTWKNICLKKGLDIKMTSEHFLHKTTSAWDNDMKKMNEVFRICSFSETNESLLMWSHYANQDKGVCVEYDLRNAGIVRTFTQPVYYSHQRISVRTIEEMNSHFHVAASICKSVDWKYEKEWRLTFFIESQTAGKNNQLYLPVPKAIYLGSRFHLNHENMKYRLTAIVESKKIPVYQMTNHPTEYRLIRIN